MFAKKACRARHTLRNRSSPVLKEAEAEARLPELCRKYGMSEATCYNWKAKYAGMTASDLKRLKSHGRRKPGYCERNN